MAEKKRSGFFDSRDHTREVNLAGYAYGLILAGAVLVVWVSLGPRDASLAVAFGAFLTAITGGLILKKGTNAAPTPAETGTENQEGGKP
jgi:hypothetical protein